MAESRQTGRPTAAGSGVEEGFGCLVRILEAVIVPEAIVAADVLIATAGHRCSMEEGNHSCI
jgi:hypothetical protein